MVVMFAGELGVGYLMNIVLDFDLWDYSGMEFKIGNFTVALHLLGQINVFYIPVWYGSSIAVYILCKFLFTVDDYLANVLKIVLEEIFEVIVKNKGQFSNDYYKEVTDRIKGE